MAVPSLAAVALAALLLSGCSSPRGTEPPQDAQGRYVIAMTSNLTFEPAEAHVPVGAKVVWRNVSPAEHDVSGYRGDPIEESHPSFLSNDPPGTAPLIQPGQEYEHTFTEKGVYTIWCHTHHEERMKGIVEVV